MQNISSLKDSNQIFIRQLLTDFNVFSQMLERNLFESDVVRIGAEQEMAIVHNENLKPATLAPEILKKLADKPWLGPEIATFNLECNMSPQVLGGDCFRKMETETLGMLSEIREALKSYDADIVLAGILPTLRKYDLDLKNLTQKPRYKAIIQALNAQFLGGKPFYELRLSGIDEILVKHDSPLLEACNTSFQVHLQTSPEEFVKLYNISQVLTPAIISMSANSPIVFGKRLWHESRIALFQQSLDTRRTHEHMRIRMPRVRFGSDWLQGSILEIFKEDISRFRILLPEDVQEDAQALLDSNQIPKLKALLLHNSTVYRWNRPCYGISDNGKPHLRIENRVIPAGPTVIDQVSNAAFWIGCVKGLALKYDDISTEFDSFVDIRDNFVRAARYGLDCDFNWLNDQKVSAKSLILDELLPVAKEGLEHVGVDASDIERYLGTIQARVEKHYTGARWQLRTYTKLLKHCTEDEALTCLTATILKNQKEEKPVHLWDIPKVEDAMNYLPIHMKVEDFMTTDLFTIQPDDSIELVSEMMNWREERYLPVEDKNGKLIGLVTGWRIIKHLKQRPFDKEALVSDVMLPNPKTIHPQNTILEAIDVMEAEKIPCMPVVTEDNELVGMISEVNFLQLTQRLIKRFAYLEKKK